MGGTRAGAVFLLGAMLAGTAVGEPDASDRPFCAADALCPGTIQFTGGGGSSLWQTGANWDLNRLPNASDDVCIPAGFAVVLSSGAQSINSLDVAAVSSLTLSGTASLAIAANSQVLGAFSLQGGTLSGAGNLTVSGTFTWTAGTMTGSGMTVAQGGSSVSGGSVKDLTGGRVLQTSGTTAWSGSGSIRQGSGGAIQNSGTWDAQGNASLTNLGSAGGFQNPSGSILKKSAGGGTTTIDVPLTNGGTVSAENGTLSLDGGGTSAGSFSGSAGALLRFGGGTHALSTGSSIAASAFEVSAGTVTFEGSFTVTDSTTVSASGTLQVLSTAAVASVGALTRSGSGTLSWSSGDTIAPTTLTLSGGTLGGSDLVSVAGAFTWTSGTLTGAATLNALGGVALSSGAVKDLTGGRVLNTSGTTTWAGIGNLRLGGGAIVHNLGTWDAQGDASMTALTGGGSFDNPAGSIFRKSAGAGTTTLSVPLSNAGTLAVESGTVSLNAGGSASGAFTGTAGTTLLFDGGTHTLGTTSSVTAATVSVTGASVAVSGAYAATTTTASSGALTFDPSASISAVGPISVSGSATVTLNSGEALAVPSLTLSGGTLGGSDTLSVAGSFIWTGGTHTGAGTTHALGGAALSSGAVKDLTGGRVLNTSGITSWAGIGNLRLGGGAVVHNLGTWDAQGDASMTTLAGGGSFDNPFGVTLKKSAGAGTTTIAVPLSSGGTLQVDSGTLSLSGGSSITGVVTGLAGTTFRFESGTHALGPASSLSGATVSVGGGGVASVTVEGTYAASTGTTVTSGSLAFLPAALITSLGALSVSGSGVLTLDSGDALTVPSVTLSGGLLGGSDSMTVAGLLTWSGGEISSAGSTTAAGGMAVTTGSVKDLTGGRTLNTSGTTAWSGGTVRLGGGAVVHNAGLWDVQGDLQITALAGGGSFDNANGSTFRKSAAVGIATVAVPFANAGTAEVTSGTLSLDGGGSTQGTLLGGPGTTVRFQATYTLLPSSTVSVASLSVTGGTVSVQGTYAASTATAVSGGTLQVPASATVSGVAALTVSGSGTAVLDSGGPIAAGTLTLSGGTLGGADDVVVSGLTTWTSGTMTGSGATQAQGGTSISGPILKDLQGGRILMTGGTTTWSDGTLRVAGGASIQNAGDWVLQADTALVDLSGAGPFANGLGAIFRKTGGSATASVGVPFTNAGTVRAASGTLHFAAGYTQTGGSTEVPGAILSAASPLQVQGGSVSGTGTIAAGVTSSGTVAPGLSPGTLAITGAYAQGANGTFGVEIGGLTPGSQHDRLNVSGAVTLGGTLSVALVSAFVPADGDEFTVLTFPSATGSFAASSFPPLPGDMTWKIRYHPTSVVLEASADFDDDGVVNSVDCAPSDPTVWAVPAEVGSFAFAGDKQTFSWATQAVSAGPATAYDAMRGLRSQLPVGSGAAETCLASSTGATQIGDATVPAPGAALYYLVRARNACGISTYGTQTGGAPRTTAACP